MKVFPFYLQPDTMDCGPACLRMIAKYYKKDFSLEELRQLSNTTRLGSSLGSISGAAEKIGFRSVGVKISYEKLLSDGAFPCIVHWNQHHFVVVYKATKNAVWVADPAHGKIKYSLKDFLAGWIGVNSDESTEDGIALFLEPTQQFYQYHSTFEKGKKKGFSFLFQYLVQYKRFIVQLVIGLVVGSLLQLIFPFLTQSVVDIGVQNRDIHFVYVILIAQLFFFAGRTSVELIRGWILLHLSTRVNISLVSDFFIKLMNLPISYFDSKMTGDIMQRINDHQRIENLLTNSSLSVLFSLFNLVIFGSVIAWYSWTMFFVFLIGSALYLGWIVLFLKRRKELDYKRFAQMSSEQNKMIELIAGMQEIKLHNAERQKRWSWEHLQARLFKLEMESLKLQQMQSTGAGAVNEIKNIVITMLSAKLVIDGDITLGMMMSISYIIGQLNGPIQQLIGFAYSVQDAKIALERLSEIHNRPNEEEDINSKYEAPEKTPAIHLSNISFHYTGMQKNVIENLSLIIPPNKTTAIVGSSGSGKTTLMKLLLKFYEPNAGNIQLGEHALNEISQTSWRNKCGVVMQEGFIFNDTIANNIAVGHDKVDLERLRRSVEIANIQEFIESLPMAYNTNIGNEGVGISTGQKQRLLIARAVYKNPDIIFFDEATSALDAKNERIIMENLNSFFKDRTAVVIAHRLSTVKNADQIVVLEDGRIIELGTHQQLVDLKGSYYSLVKNQLELEKLNAGN